MLPLVDIHTHRTTPREGVISIYNLMLGPTPETPVAPYSAGIHPWNATEATDEWMARLEALCDSPTPPVMIGEAGLDLRKQFTPDIPTQHQWFERQAELACKVGIPLIIHSVDAIEPTLAQVRSLTVPAVIHAFTGSWDTARRLLDAGCYLSFGSRTMRSPRSLDALRRCPTDRIFFESDDSPVEISTLYELVRGTDPEALKQQIITNLTTIIKCPLPLGVNEPNCL